MTNAATAVVSRTGRLTRGGTDWLRKQAGKVTDGSELPVSPDEADRVGVEAWLQARGVQYAPASQIPIGLIDETRSRGNQARREAILPESVDRYAVAMRAGAVFPPIVVYPDSGRLVIIDGNNRQAGARRAGLDTVLGIVIAESTPSELVHLLTVEANARHGVTPELTWRVQQAFNLCALGWPDQSAAEATGMSVAQLRNARNIADTDGRARNLRVAGFADLPASSKSVLHGVKDDEVFARLSRLAVSTAMTTDDIRDCTRALKGLTSEAARLEYLAGVLKDRTAARVIKRAARGQHSRVHSHRMSLLAAVGKIANVDPTALAKQVVTVADRDTIVKRVADLKKHLTLIEVAMKSLTLSDAGQ